MNTHKPQSLVAICLATYVLLSSLGIRVLTALPQPSITMEVGCCEADACAVAACGSDCCIIPTPSYWLSYWVSNTSPDSQDSSLQLACLARTIFDSLPIIWIHESAFRALPILVSPLSRSPRDTLRHIQCFRC